MQNKTPEQITQDLKQYGHVYDMFRTAVENPHTEPILKEANDLGSANLSSIYSLLIQDTGRFAENYASDLLYDLDHIRAILSERPIPEPEYHIIPIAIRKDGVDGISFTVSRLLQTTKKNPFTKYAYPGQDYRRLYLLKIQIEPAEYRPKVKAELYDMSTAILEPTDTDFAYFDHLNHPEETP